MAALLCVCTLFRARICLALSLDRSMDAYGFSLCKCWGRIIAHGVLFPRVRPFLRPPTIFLPRPSIAPRPKAGIIFVPRTRRTLGANVVKSVPIPLPHCRRRVFLRFMTDCIKKYGVVVPFIALLCIHGIYFLLTGLTCRCLNQRLSFCMTQPSTRFEFRRKEVCQPRKKAGLTSMQS